MGKVYLILFIFCTNFIVGQKPNPSIKSLDSLQIISATDMATAIDISKASKVIVRASPKGSGKKIEVASGSLNDKYYFEKEHNVLWLKFKASKTGLLSLTIRPQSKEDDYDFLIFKINDESDLKKISTKKLKPIRTNKSRNSEENKGITGLSTSSTLTHVSSGPQNEFSSFIAAKQDDEYFLVLDNVYDNGKGAIIYFEYYDTKKISGYVSDETKEKKVAAEVTWEDGNTGQVLQKTTSDPKTGYFEMIVPFVITNPDKIYLISIDADDYFFEEQTFTTKQILEKDATPLNVVLPNLKKGLRSRLHNINFDGGSARLLSSATPSLKRLKKLMTKNDKLEIVIEGHTNGCSDGGIDAQLLSEHRALQVKKYLFDNGVSVDRIATKGYNCEKMLYPNPINQEQQHLNRRVEILVTEY